MSTICENSCVDQLFNSNNPEIQKVAEDIRDAVKSTLGRNAAILLVAVATDKVTGIQNRNDRPDVRAAVASLRASIAVLQAIEDNLDG